MEAKRLSLVNRLNRIRGLESSRIRQHYREQMKFWDVKTEKFTVEDILNKKLVAKQSSEWTHVQKSNYIEYLLLGAPLHPSIILKERGQKLIIRTHIEEVIAVREYLDNKFSLISNKYLTELDGLSAEYLPRDTYQKLIYTPVQFSVLPEEVDEDTVEYLKGFR